MITIGVILTTVLAFLAIVVVALAAWSATVASLLECFVAVA